MPLSGEVIEINTELADEPSQLNDSPYGDGWLIKMRFSDQNEVDDLLTAEEYKTYLDTH